MYEVRISYVPQRMALVARRPVSAENAADVIPAVLAELLAYVEAGGACGAEETLAIFPHDFAEPGEHEVRVVVTVADGVPGPGIELDELPGCQVVKTEHAGAFCDTTAGWVAIEEWMDERDLDPAGDYWEVYLTGPDAEEFVTELLRPLP